MHMKNHLENLRFLYNGAYVQIPNNIFKKLSSGIGGNVKQVSFAYTYLVLNSFLYKYAHFVDIDNKTYIQNGDIKQILGYGKKTKTIDKIIKKDGVLEELGLVITTKDYPISVKYTEERVNGVNMRDFITIGMSEMSNVDNFYYNTIKNIVKNKNYTIKEPVFLFDNDGDIGTLYDYSNTHRITIDELMHFINNGDNTDFFLYGFFKHKCYGRTGNKNEMALYKIISETGMSRGSFYAYLEKMEKVKTISVIRKKWSNNNDNKGEGDANAYVFRPL